MPRRQEPSQTARVGQPAPGWTEPSLPGPTLALASLHGKAVYLNFFATWCPPCNEEAPAIDALQRAYGNARSCKSSESTCSRTRERRRSFATRTTSVYPVVVDAGRYAISTTSTDFRYTSSSIATGSCGKIVVGELSPADMRSDVEQILR